MANAEDILPHIKNTKQSVIQTDDTDDDMFDNPQYGGITETNAKLENTDDDMVDNPHYGT